MSGLDIGRSKHAVIPSYGFSLSYNDLYTLNQTLLQLSYGHQRTVIITIIDSSLYLDALNFHVTAVQRHQLRTHLFLCIDDEIASMLKEHGIKCFKYKPEIDQLSHRSNMMNNPGDFGTQKYYDVTNIKTRVLMDLVMLDFTVLMCDVDVYLFENPVPDLDAICDGCHMQSQMDSFIHNTGFIYVKPTKSMLNILKIAYDLYENYRSANDQVYFNRAIERFTKGQGYGTQEVMVIRELDRQRYATGKIYFEHHQHHLARTQPPVGNFKIVHNNYVGSTAAKRYRFKENLMWNINIHFNGLDYVGGYYNNENNYYLLYGNPQYFNDDTLLRERQALKNAMILALLTDRILILPEFHCCQCLHHKISCDHPRHKCSLLNIAKIKTLDKHFSTRYREHSFIYNNKTIFANNDRIEAFPVIYLNTTSDVVPDVEVRHVITPSHHANSAARLLEYLQKFESARVLKFYSLYDAMYNLIDMDEQRLLDEKFDAIYECIDYEQWEQKDVWV